MADYSKTDPGMVQFLNQFYGAEVVGFEAIGLENARAMLDAFPDMVDAPAVEIGEVRDLEVDGAEGPLKARLYLPENVQPNSPGLIFYHGGGWVMGGIASHDRPCRRICKLANIPVLAVDYRLAPEHPFPAADEDAIASFHWACDHADELSMDKNRLAVAGDSAGGYLSAAMALKLRGAAKGEPAVQLLIYPALRPFGDAPSHKEFGEGFALDSGDIKFFTDSYFREKGNDPDPEVWPLLSKDLKGAAQAIIVSCGQDPLRDDGFEYAKALEEAGVPVVHQHYPSMTHGFLSMTALSPKAMEGFEAVARELGNQLYGLPVK